MDHHSGYYIMFMMFMTVCKLDGKVHQALPTLWWHCPGCFDGLQFIWGRSCRRLPQLSSWQIMAILPFSALMFCLLATLIAACTAFSHIHCLLLCDSAVPHTPCWYVIPIIRCTSCRSSIIHQTIISSRASFCFFLFFCFCFLFLHLLLYFSLFSQFCLLPQLPAFFAFELSRGSDGVK